MNVKEGNVRSKGWMSRKVMWGVKDECQGK